MNIPAWRHLAGPLVLAVLSTVLAERAAAQEPDPPGQDAVELTAPAVELSAPAAELTAPAAELTAPAVELTTPLDVEFGRGRASWYGGKFHGRRTSSGERFDMNELTAAHPTLRFGTLVRVRNVANGREVVVRITDRGPWVRHRIIDLSRAAAAALGFLKAGEAAVVLIRH